MKYRSYPLRLRFRQLLVLCFVTAVSSSVTLAQTLRFSNHREVAIPEYAVLRIGPFYSSVALSQSVGYRYTTGKGTGIDYLFQNQRGVFLKDGSDVPLVSTLVMKNYLIISRHTDLDISLQASYSHYPMKTQKDEFLFDPVQEGILGEFSMEFELTPFVKATVYNNASYRTDYVDTRGIADRYGGSAYEHFSNKAGLNLDWLMAKDKNMGLTFSRTDNIPRDEQYKAQEGISYEEGLAYQQVLNPQVMVGASASLNQYSYTAATNNRPDSSFQVLMLSSTLKPTKRTTISAGLGYSQVSLSGASSVTSSVPDAGVVGSLSVKTELAEGLEHTIGYSRTQSAAFNAAFENNEKYSYHLNWKDRDGTTIGIYSDYLNSQTSDAQYGDYTDWSSGIAVSYPLTQIVSLVFDSVYAIRDNKGSAGSQTSSSAELTSDYSTWSSKIGTAFLVYQNDSAATRKVVFSTYVQHIERTSDSESLKYSRDVFVATFTYSHQF